MTISCPSQTQCTVVYGYEGGDTALTFNPQTSTTIASQSLSSVGHLSCPTTTECVGASSDGQVFVFDPQSASGGAYQPIENDTVNMGAVSCPSPGSCVASDVYSAGGAGNPLSAGWSTFDPIAGSAQISDIACPTTSECIAVDQAGNAVVGTRSYLLWSGTGTTSAGWSSATNWGGAGTPTGASTTLEFPPLVGCDGATAHCYQSNNDLSGLTVDSVAIDGGGYTISGNGLSIGSGGMQASTAGTSTLSAPITLASAQSWLLHGDGSGSAQLNLTGGLVGVANSLTLQFSNQGTIALSNDNEVGTVATETPPNDYVDVYQTAGTLTLTGTLNATDGNPTKIANANLVSVGGTVGPLELDQFGEVTAGDGSPSSLTVAGLLTDNGGTVQLYIAHDGTTAGTDYSQIIGSGDVNLGNGTLSLLPTGAACPSLTPGTTETLITTTGLVNGTFNNAANGATVDLSCGAGTQLPFQINYTAHTVTATVLTLDTTSTAVVCAPTSVTVGSASTCTATVTDTASPGATTPSGSVSFTSSPTSGSFGSAGSCTLAATGTAGVASCQLSFTPSAAGSYTITGNYGGDSAHGASSGQSAALTGNALTDATSTAVVCAPTSVTVGSALTCTATVTDTASPGATTPSGSVSFTSSPTSGSFGSAGSCTLAATGTAGVASCQLSFTPSSAGGYTVTGSYQGDSTHSSSSGQSNSIAASTPAPPPAVDSTSTSVACSPGAVFTGAATTCTATVTDTAASGASTPSGSVSFTSSPNSGSFGSSGSCTLTVTGTSGVASCQVTFTPSSVGGYTITGSYAGDNTHHASSGQAASITATTKTSPPPPGPGSLSLPAGGKVSSKGVVSIKVACTGASGSSCAGKLTLTAVVNTKVKRKVKGHLKTVTVTKTITLGSASYTLSAGSSQILTIKLSAANLKLFNQAGHKLKTSATNRPANGSSTKTINLT